jgi:hypothetical protein
MLGMFDRQHKGTIGFEDFGALWKYVIDFKSPKKPLLSSIYIQLSLAGY